MSATEQKIFDVLRKNECLDCPDEWVCGDIREQCHEKFRLLAAAIYKQVMEPLEVRLKELEAGNE